MTQMKCTIPHEVFGYIKGLCIKLEAVKLLWGDHQNPQSSSMKHLQMVLLWEINSHRNARCGGDFQAFF